ncbi:MAG: hypothetical protein LBG66_04195, partial [Gallionellaceae bacterium]|nr:hypothetical protein [Gallionellaceae bacterium]
MANQLQAMKAQLDALKAENQKLSTQQQEQAKTQAAQNTQVQQLQTAQINTEQSLQQAASKPSPLDNLSIFGYGEIGYTRPTHKTDDTTMDLSRAVFGFGYRFDDKTHFSSEFEVEHAVASADDAGEIEVEQFYVDHQLTDNLGLRAGLFLMPVGLLNEHHEPTAYYGVYRNFVETLIIPSTWREGGVALNGNTDSGLDWSVGLTTGLNLSGWDFAPETPAYNSALTMQTSDSAPLQTSHQELSFANAKDPAQYISLNYHGVPGLLVGGSVFTGKAVPVAGVDSQRVTLWEAHARYNPGKLDVSALYADGRISNTAQANLRYAGTANPMPASFNGGYLQAAYTVWERDEQRLTPFIRGERYNMGKSYDGIAPGFAPPPNAPVTADGSVFLAPRDTVWTAGLNYYLTDGVVFKADYQWF